MRKYLIVLPILTFAYGCVEEYTWQHPDKTEQQYLEDKLDCRLYANQIGTLYRQIVPNVGPARPTNNSAAFWAGFMGAANKAAPLAQAQQAFCDCMRAKGWTYLPINKNPYADKEQADAFNAGRSYPN